MTAVRFGRLIFATIRKSVGLKILTTKLINGHDLMSSQFEWLKMAVTSTSIYFHFLTFMKTTEDTIDFT